MNPRARSPRRFEDLVRARLRARLATRVAAGFLLLLCLLAGLAPLLADDRPLWIPGPEGASSPLLAALDAADVFGLAAAGALALLVLAPRRGRLAAILLAGLGLALGLLVEPRLDGRPYVAEMETRRILAERDRALLPVPADPRAARAAYQELLESMPLLAELSIEIEDRIEALEGAARKETLGALAERNRAALEALDRAVFPPIRYAPERPGPDRHRPPDRRHLFGTDAAGRDLFARLLHGARHTLGLALAATVLATGLGLLLGGLAGWKGGGLDWTIARLADTASALPALLILVLATAYLPPTPAARSLGIILLLAAVGWVLPARFVRAEVAALRARDFVLAAESLGIGPGRLFFRHLLPNASTALLVAASTLFGAVVIAEAGLSFLGLGVPGAPSWGQSLREAREAARLGEAWHLALFPGLAIFLTVIAVNHLADALRDAGDPRGRA